MSASALLLPRRHLPGWRWYCWSSLLLGGRCASRARRALDCAATVLGAFITIRRTFDHRIIVDYACTLMALLHWRLGVAGCCKIVIRNPLGEPHIFGLNAGASAGGRATIGAGNHFGGVALARPLTVARWRGAAVY